MSILTEKQMRMLAPALDLIMAARPTIHRHSCEGCGDWFMCAAARDTCPTDWTCPTCLEKQLDEYWQSQQEADRADHR